MASKPKKEKRILVIGDFNSIHLQRWLGYIDPSNTTTALHIARNVQFSADDFPAKFIFCRTSPHRSLRVLQGLGLIVKIFMRRREFDVINIIGFSAYYATMILVVRMPAVVTCMGSDILVRYKNSKLISHIVQRAALRKARAITFTSPVVRDVIEGRDPGFHYMPLHHLPWSIDEGFFQMDLANKRAALRQKLGIETSSCVFLNIRAVSPFYRTKEIIEWFLSGVGDEDCLLIHVPPHSDDEYVSDLKQEYRLCQNIVWHEKNIPYSQVSDLYQLSDIVIHAPVSDAYAVSIFESMASGCSVVLGSKIPTYQKLVNEFDLQLIDIMQMRNASSAYILGDAAKASNREHVRKRFGNTVIINDLNHIFYAL